MHPELLSSLAIQHNRNLAANVRGDRTAATAARRHRTRRALLPSYRVSWSRTTLAAAAGRHRGRSVVIVISATRML